MLGSMTLTGAKETSLLPDNSNVISLNENESTIHFTSTHPDSLNLPSWGGVDITATMSMIPVHEEIIAYPKNYKVKDVFYLNIQPQQYFFSLCHKSEEDSLNVINILKQEWFENAKSKYLKEYVDCLVSYCLLENEAGEQFVVFDQNNDEDFSNDTILTFKKKLDFYYPNQEIDFVQADVEAAYYNGSAIQTTYLSIGFVKRSSTRLKRDILTISILNMGACDVFIENKKYTAGIIENYKIEYGKYSFLWIDLNQNGKPDLEGDTFSQMHKPIKIFDQTFKVSFIDRFGKMIKLSKNEE